MDLLHAHRVSPFELRSSRLVLFAMWIRFAPSVRKSACVEKADFTLKGTLPYKAQLRFAYKRSCRTGEAPGSEKPKPTARSATGKVL